MRGGRALGALLSCARRCSERALFPLVAALAGCSPGGGDGEPTETRAAGLTAAQQAKLFASDAAGGSYFSRSVALAGDTAIVGSPGANGLDSGSGAAYVLVRTGSSWTQQAKLVAADGANGDGFGYAVAISGDTAVVGANNVATSETDVAVGAAYVFVRSGGSWAQQAKLLASDGVMADRFGGAVAITGDTAVVGASDANPKGTDSGAAYVFVRSGATWTEQAKLVPSDGATSDAFGGSVGVAGNMALVGADQHSGKGAAYIFEKSGAIWSEKQKLVPTEPAISDKFGSAVALTTDTAVVGAILDDDKALNAGSAYVFGWTGGTWVQQAKLLASDGAEYDWFGGAVAISGQTVLVGADQDGDKGVTSGSAYVFVKSANVWTQEAKLLASDGDSYDYFGSAVGLSGDTALVGAYFDEEKGTYAGAAYVFVLGGGTCTTPSQCGSGFCVDGVCCLSACAGSCSACTKVKGAAIDGVCTILPQGNPGAPSCAPYLCNGVAGTCPTSCTIGTQCSTGFCADGVCCDKACSGVCQACIQSKSGKPDGTCGFYAAGTDPDAECKDKGSPTCQENGLCDGAGACQKYPSATGCAPLPCAGNAECESGYCADGICCDAACTGPCMACTAAKKGTGVDGKCEPIVADTDPDQECALDPGYPASCKADGLCDGQGACRTIAKAGTACKPGETTCNGNQVTGLICDGKGPNCVADPSGTSCAPYLCVGKECSKSCTSDVDCDANGYCTTAGTCSEKQPNGPSCARKEECKSGLCVDGRCCNGACTGQCEACDVKGAEGSCVAVTGAPHGGRPACPTGSAQAPCSAATCDGKTPTTCAGFVGADIVCSPTECDGTTLAPEAHCDGNGSCKQPGSVDCGAYQCKDGACGTTCASDADCAKNHTCKAGSCVSQASCDGDHTLTIPGAGQTDCSPYHCTPTGACLTACVSSADCVTGHACSSDKKCVAKSAPESPEEGGCGCSFPGRSRGSSLLALALGLLALGARRRR